MPNSEDYTVVWVGICQELRPGEVQEAKNGKHQIIRSADSAGLEHWLDTFETSPEGERIYQLLVGRRLDLLGFKEGRSRLSLSPEALLQHIRQVDEALMQMGLNSRAELHVLLRIEE
jgi:hypothetical protein